jgi:hypothetical protein
MIETFTALLTGHLLADFLLQTDWLIARKRKWPFLLLHVAIVSVATAVTIGAWTLAAGEVIALVTVTHLVLDYLKIRLLGDTLTTFLADQAGHLLVLICATLLVPDLARSGVWGLLSGTAQAWLYAGMTAVCGAIIAVPMGGIVIKKLVGNLAPSFVSTGLAPSASVGQTGMAQGGTYIGWLERGLTVMFVLAGKAEGVGFLLAAKSILRFGEIRHDADRHLQEYIIIGTLLSFGWGLAAAILTAKAIAYWGVG